MVVFCLDILCILLYGTASACAAVGVLRDWHRSAWWGRGLFFGAAALHSAIVGIESTAAGGTLLSGPNIAMLASWVLAAVTVVGLIITKRGLAIAAVTAPVIALLMVASQWLRILDPVSASNRAFYEWPLLVPHIVLVFMACACFAVSAAASVMLLYQRRLMRRHSAQVLVTATPALDTLAKMARWAALVGLLLFTGAMLIGFTHMVAQFAAMAHARCAGNLAYLAPRVALSLAVSVIWALYAGLSFLAPGVAGTRTRALLSLGGFAAMLVLIAVSAG